MQALTKSNFKKQMLSPELKRTISVGLSIFILLFLAWVKPILVPFGAVWLFFAVRNTLKKQKDEQQMFACPKCTRMLAQSTRICPRCDHRLKEQ